MRDLITLILIASALFAIGWFISFQYDPYRVCVDHPESAMKQDYYLCEPGGFTLQKGTRLERPPEDRFIWEKHGDVIIGTENPAKRQKKQQELKIKNQNLFNCSDKFYQLTDEQVLKLTEKEINEYCPSKKTKTPQIEAPIYTEEL